LRVYWIGRAYQPADIDTGDVARWFLAWLANDAGMALTRLIRAWLVLPADAGGLGALAGSEADVAALQAEVAALCRQPAAGHSTGRPAATPGPAHLRPGQHAPASPAPGSPPPGAPQTKPGDCR